MSKKKPSLIKKRRDFVKCYIRARKETETITKLEKEFEHLGKVLFLSAVTIRNDYYSEDT